MLKIKLVFILKLLCIRKGILILRRVLSTKSEATLISKKNFGNARNFLLP